MALSDCIECWSTPCICGYEYENWSNDTFAKFIHGILGKRNNSDIQSIIDIILNLRNIKPKTTMNTEDSINWAHHIQRDLNEISNNK